MLIATSPRLSSDQEKNKTTEDACPAEVICTTSKCNYGLSDNRGDNEMYEDLSRQMPTSQSTYQCMTDGITPEHTKELFDHRQTIPGQRPVYCSSAKSTVTQSETLHCTKHSTKSQGEEFIYYIQHAEGPREEPDNTLDSALQTDEFCNSPQTAAVESEESTFKTVQSEELHSSTETPTIQSMTGSPLQTSTTQLGLRPNHLQISVKSDKLCKALTTSAQSQEPCPTLHVATVQSDEPSVQSQKIFKSLQTAVVQPEGLCSSIQTTAVLAERPDQSEELNRSIVSEKLNDFLNTSSSKSVNYKCKESEFVQPGVLYKVQQPANTRLDDLCDTEQAVPDHSERLYQFMQPTTVQAEGHEFMETTEDNDLKSDQRTPTQLAETYCVKQPSAVPSEEIYLSRTCDSRWSDSVTANKVAVEGDLNG